MSEAHVSPPPTPQPKLRPRRRPFVSRPFALIAAVGSVLASFGLHEAAPSLALSYQARMADLQGRNTIAQRGFVGEAGALHEEIRRLAMGLDRAARSTASIQQLPPLDSQRVVMPMDAVLYADEVARFATSHFDEASMKEALLRHGHPAAVAAVAWLQEQDYWNIDACVAACRVQGLLASLTGIDGLQAEEPFADPDEPAVRRFRAVATAWRRILERHARDASSFAALLVLTKRGKPLERKD